MLLINRNFFWKLLNLVLAMCFSKPKFESQKIKWLLVLLLIIIVFPIEQQNNSIKTQFFFESTTRSSSAACERTLETRFLTNLKWSKLILFNEIICCFIVTKWQTSGIRTCLATDLYSFPARSSDVFEEIYGFFQPYYIFWVTLKRNIRCKQLYYLRNEEFLRI